MVKVSELCGVEYYWFQITFVDSNSGQSIWDNFTNTTRISPGSAMNASYVRYSILDDYSAIETGDLAADSYYKSDLDVQVIMLCFGGWF